MANTGETLLITGATGRQGGAVLRHLLKQRGWKLRALVHRADPRGVDGLKQQGVEFVQGDLEDVSSLEAAVRGVYGVYSVQNFWAVGAKREVQQGKNLAAVAKKAGVQHLVYSSVGGAERKTGIPHWESKWEIENYIRQLKLPTTIIRPVSFMETYHILEVEVGILKGKLADAVRADKPYQTIASDDIGAFAALAFARPKDFVGLELEIAGSELTNPEAAKVFSLVMGKPIKFQKLPLPIVRIFLGKEFYLMFRWFNEAGYKANIPELKRLYPEVHLHSLEEWLREDGWDKRALRFRAPKG